MSTLEIGYTIITNTNYLDEQNAITPELSRKLEYFHNLALKGKKSSIKKLLKAIEKYPANPQLKNYLSVLYGQIGDTQKMYDVNKWIIAEHPQYLFGKLNLANEYYLKEEFEKMPKVLGEAMEIQALYPERDTFHINEVISFFKCAIFYFTSIGNMEQAEIRYEIMCELAPDSPDTEMALQQIILANIIKSQQRYAEEEKSNIKVKIKQQQINTTSIAPSFKHQEIEWLYCNGLYIDKEKLNQLLGFPKDSLVQDLELVLIDSINRYGYFKKYVEENGWDEERMNFVVHAMYLLGELKATTSIDTFFKVLNQSEEFLELYLGDFVTSMLWEPLYKIAANNLDACKQFLFKPGVDTYARSTMPDLVEQIAFHQPERRDEILIWFNDVIQFFLNSSFEDNVIDSELIAFVICSIIHIEGSELVPEIEKLFKAGIVAQGICGDWNEVSHALTKPNKLNSKREILPITERYQQITTTWAGYGEEEIYEPDNFEDYFQSPLMPVRTEPKIGRNEPCPCGSGKKYKKCCLT